LGRFWTERITDATIDVPSRRGGEQKPTSSAGIWARSSSASPARVRSRLLGASSTCQPGGNPILIPSGEADNSQLCVAATPGGGRGFDTLGASCDDCQPESDRSGDMSENLAHAGSSKTETEH